MLDINNEAKKSLEKTGYNLVYQYPEHFSRLPVISYYNLSEKGAFYADNNESIQEGYVQIDIWSRSPKECYDISIEVNNVLTSDGWTREMSMDVPRGNDKLYHRTMRFQKYFTLE